MKSHVNANIVMILSLFALIRNSVAQGSGKWAETDSLSYKRNIPSSVKMDDGRVLLSGGSYDGYKFHGIPECELFDPLTNAWTEIRPMNVGRTSHVSILMNDGNVLVCGGYNSTDSPYHMLNNCEVYSPANGTWIEVDTMKVRRVEPEILKLHDGRILIIGGRTMFGTGSTAEDGATEKCELYDPAVGEWKLTASLSKPRTGHRATLLPNGKVLVTGGNYWGGPKEKSCEIFDPVSETWNDASSMNVGRILHNAVLLNDNRVLVIGGNNQTCEVYNYLNNSWSFVSSTNISRLVNSDAVKMNNGNIFITTLRDSICELYHVINDVWHYTNSLPFTQGFGSLTILDDGRILIAGGEINGKVSNRSFVFCPDSVTLVNDGETINNFQLNQNYPNPFNPSTIISFTIPDAMARQNVSLKIYSINGELIKTFFEKDLPAGNYVTRWEGTNENGLAVPSGVYLYKVSAGNKFVTGKMSLVK